MSSIKPIPFQQLPGPWIPGTLQGFLTFRDPYGSLRYIDSKFGDRTRIAFIGKAGVLLSRPADIEEVFLHDPKVLLSGTAYQPLTPSSIDRFMLVLDGDDYKNVRKVVSPPFRTQAMPEYADAIRLATHEEFDQARPGDVFNLVSTLDRIAFQIACNLMGRGKGMTVPEGFDDFFAPHSTLSLFADLWGMARGTRRYNDRRFRHLLATVPRCPHANTDHHGNPNGIASRLSESNRKAKVPLDEQTLDNQYDGIFWTIMNTMASALQLVFSHLLTVDGIQQRLGRSLSNESSCSGRVDTLAAFCLEALRITPPVPLLIRHASQDLEIAGVAIPKGSLIGVSIYGAHHRAETHKNPEEFNLDRFLEREYSPFEYLPFGSPRRGCLATIFAPFVLRTVVRETVTSYRLESVGANRPRRRLVNLVVRQDRPLMVKAMRIAP